MQEKIFRTFRKKIFLISALLGTVCVLTFGLTGTALSQGPVAYYPFSGNADDASGNGNHGTVIGATPTEDINGVPNSAYRVGDGNYIQVGDDNSLDLQSAFTISLLFNMEAVKSSFNCLIGKNYASAYAIGISSGGSNVCPAPSGIKRNMWLIIERPPSGGSHYHLFAFELSDFSCDTWYHVAVTFDDASDSAKLFVNGVFIDTGLIDTVVADATPLINTSPLGIGKDGSHTDKFNGVIDEVYIFDRVLSAAEIQQLIGCPAAPSAEADPCDGLGGDKDGDTICDNGDGLGEPGDNPCTGGSTTDCDDNCVDTVNADQLDTDGDGVGDACDCYAACDDDYPYDIVDFDEFLANTTYFNTVEASDGEGGTEIVTCENIDSLDLKGRWEIVAIASEADDDNSVILDEGEGGFKTIFSTEDCTWGLSAQIDFDSTQSSLMFRNDTTGYYVELDPFCTTPGAPNCYAVKACQLYEETKVLVHLEHERVLPAGTVVFGFEDTSPVGYDWDDIIVAAVPVNFFTFGVRTDDRRLTETGYIYDAGCDPKTGFCVPKLNGCFKPLYPGGPFGWTDCTRVRLKDLLKTKRRIDPHNPGAGFVRHNVEKIGMPNAETPIVIDDEGKNSPSYLSGGWGWY